MLQHLGIMPNNEGKELCSFEKAALPLDSRARAALRTAIAILVVLLAAWVARDFLMALIWAAVIAIAVWPIYVRFSKSIGRFPVLAPLPFTLFIALILLMPIVW